MMHEIGTLANQLMVPAILENKKTVTRRLLNNIVNGAPNKWDFLEYSENIKGRRTAIFKQNDLSFFADGYRNTNAEVPFEYAIGDLLWVREDHSLSYDHSTMSFFCLYRTGEMKKMPLPSLSSEDATRLFNRKTLGTGQLVAGRYLPKCLARIWLIVTGVRVEKLQAIDDQEAIREGVEQLQGYHSPTYRHYQDDGSRYHVTLTPRTSFVTLITHLHGHDIWDKDPWVWVVDFEVLSTAGRPSDDLIAEARGREVLA